MTPIFMVAVPVVLVIFAVFECFHYRWSEVDFKTSLDLSGQAQSTSVWHIFNRVWPIARVYAYASDDTYGPAHGKMFAMVCLSLGLLLLFIGFCFNLWMKEFWDCL